MAHIVFILMWPVVNCCGIVMLDGTHCFILMRSGANCCGVVMLDGTHCFILMWPGVNFCGVVVLDGTYCFYIDVVKDQLLWQLCHQIGAGLYAVGRPVQKRNDEDGQIGTIQSLPLERGALFNRFFGEPAHGPPHVAGGASGPIGGCRDESRTDHPDLDLRHVFDINNRKTDLI